MKPIKLMICDDHQIFIDGLKSGLEEAPEIEIICTANGSNEALLLLEKHSVDVILMDVEMPNLNGIGLTHLISKNILLSKLSCSLCMIITI